LHTYCDYVNILAFRFIQHVICFKTIFIGSQNSNDIKIKAKKLGKNASLAGQSYTEIEDKRSKVSHDMLHRWMPRVKLAHQFRKNWRILNSEIFFKYETSYLNTDMYNFESWQDEESW